MFTSICALFFAFYVQCACKYIYANVCLSYRLYLCVFGLGKLLLSLKPQKPLKPSAQCASKPPSAFPLWQPASGHITHHTNALQSPEPTAHQNVQIDAPTTWLICEVGYSLHIHTYTALLTMLLLCRISNYREGSLAALKHLNAHTS